MLNATFCSTQNNGWDFSLAHYGGDKIPLNWYRLWNMSCLLRLPTPLPSNFKALYSRNNRLRALSDAIVLLAGRCHLHARGSVCTLVAAKQDVALYTSISVCSNSDMRSAYCCRTVYSTGRQPADIYGMTHRWGRRHVHSGKYNITEESGTETQTVHTPCIIITSNRVHLLL